MSIVKNRTGSTTDVTIMKFEKDVAFATPLLPSGHPLLGFTARYYLDLTSYYFRLGFYPRAGETVIIKAAFPEDASGVVYGVTGASGRYIKAENGYLRWYNGTTVVFEREIDGKPHNFGYQGYSDNGVLKCKPYYDKENISVAGSTGGSTTQKAVIGGATAASPTDIVSRMYLYEVMASSYPDASDETQSVFHYYAAINASNVSCLMETCHDLVAVLGSGTTKSAVNFPNKGYGVQLHDLIWITESGFKDAIAVLCENGGVDVRAGWTGVSGRIDTAESPYKLTKSGESDREFAIYLGSSGSHLPIPSGWTIPAARSYETGELIKGRRVKWDIWCDSLKWGKYGVGNIGQITTMKFNIMRENDGTLRTKFDLERFHGWNTGNSHAPNLELSGKLHIEYHNGYSCRLTYDDRLCGSINPGYDYTRGDERFVFPFNREAGGLGNVKLGNLPLWNYSEAEQETQSDLSKLWAIGGGVQLKILDVSSQVGWRTFAIMMKSVMDVVPPDTFVDGGQTYPMPFSSDSSQATLDMFRNNGFDCSSVLRDATVEQMRDEHSELCVRSIKASLMLTKSVEPTPYDSQLIDCSRLVAEKQGEVEGIFDNKICYYNGYGLTHDDTDIHYNDRFVVGEHGGIAKIGLSEYLIGVQGDNRNTMWGQYLQTVSGAAVYGKGICLGFGLKNKNNDTLYTLLDNGVSDVMAFMEVIEADVDEGTVTTETIDTYDTEAISPIALNDLVRAVSVYVSAPSYSGARTFYTEEEGTNSTIYKFYCQGSGLCKFNVKLSISTATKVQTEVEFALNCYDISMDEPVLTIVVPTTNSATITGNVTNVDCDIRIRKGWHRWVNNRYIGFSKVFPAQNTDTYISPYAYNTNFNATKVQPWGIGGSRASTIGSVLFMWRDLLGTRNVDTERPTKTVDSHTNALPSTFHMRVYSKTTGPHAWNLMWNGSKSFDTLCETPFMFASSMGDIKRIYFHNACTLIEHKSQINNYVDALISLWKTKGSYYVDNDQITSPDSLNGKSVVIYEEPLHEPVDEWDFERDSSDNMIPLVRFDISGLSSSRKTDTFDGKVPDGGSWVQDRSYRCRVTADFTSGSFVRKPTGTARHGEVGLGGFFRVEVWNGDTEHYAPASGAIYYIDIINTPA